MARIPQAFIDELISRVDIVEVIDARVPLKKHGREFTACCPFHNEKTPSFTVSPTKQFFHCFGCGVHGTALGFLMDYEHLDFVEAVRQLASLVGMEVPLDAGETRSDYAPLYAALDQAAQIYREALKHNSAAIAYLKHRGLSGEIAAEFGIGFAPLGWDTLLTALGKDDAAQKNLLAAGLVIRKDGGGYYDRFRARIMFPIRDSRGRIIALGGRVLDKEEPKYLNSPETPLFHKGRELYGLYEARQALRDIPRLLVVEGYMDVVALHQHGLRYAVATLGTATTAEHLQRLFRVTAEVVFCFDGDRAGRDAAWKAVEAVPPFLQAERQVRFLFLPEGEDPDTLVRKEGTEAFEARVAAGVPFQKMLKEYLLAQGQTTGLKQRARELLARCPDKLYRELLLSDMSLATHADYERLTMLTVGSAPSGGPSAAGIFVNTPVRRALSLLLNQPALAALAGEPAALEGSGLKGAEVLKAVLEFALAHPHISGAGLLEHWRDTETGSYLMKLAQAELITPAEAMPSEFKAVMADLVGGRPDDRRFMELRAKVETMGFEALTEPEKLEFRRLHIRRPSGPKP